ncbi:hypothetical protein GIB67_040102 [Kingdonia uniflora]|uniref:Uncharacterized protein n=1 Tax=Kingdonia uniflora TaxID=39325 RepID=A0A7J7MV71_9MAGN|nr:hypothetical protein GIB67_040102 [Kingdonia uniflora]
MAPIARTSELRVDTTYTIKTCGRLRLKEFETASFVARFKNARQKSACKMKNMLVPPYFTLVFPLSNFFNKMLNGYKRIIFYLFINPIHLLLSSSSTINSFILYLKTQLSSFLINFAESCITKSLLTYSSLTHHSHLGSYSLHHRPVTKSYSDVKLS